MNPQDIERLKICQDGIRTDVTFDSVAPALIQAGLLNREDVQQIQARESDAQKMDRVLEILPTKGPEALTKFTSVLQKNYRWLAERIIAAKPSTTNDSNTINNANNRMRMENLNQKVSSDMMAMLSKNYRVAQRWTSLAHSLQLDSHIAPIRIRILLYHEDLNLCITYLLKEWESQCPKTANLGNLLAVLRENSFNDVADELEQKFAN